MIEAPICTVGPSRPTDAPQQAEQGQQDLAGRNAQRNQAFARGLVGQMTCSDRLRDPTALRVLKEAVGQKHRQREPGRRQHQRGILEMGYHCAKCDLRQIRELCEGDGRRTDRNAAQQEQGPALPARGDQSEQPPLAVGGESHSDEFLAHVVVRYEADHVIPSTRRRYAKLKKSARCAGEAAKLQGRNPYRLRPQSSAISGRLTREFWCPNDSALARSFPAVTHD
ncbi:hypothetical protein J2R87_002729 [Bradyrhizobium elkanii]|nr:hypothetical protein [Bradyrhizobium elkanii]MCS4109504.1 hypothetical protein [Bradyrhizobium elkanii]